MFRCIQLLTTIPSVVYWALAWVACAATPALAQNRLFGNNGNDGDSFSIVGAFDSSLGADPAKVSAQFVPPTASRPAVLFVTARMSPGWHTYAIDQPRGRTGGPQATKIVLAPSPRYRLLSQFRSVTAPKTHIDNEAWVGLELREHEGEVTWFAPIEFAPGIDPATAEVRGLVDMQVCKEQCVPLKPEFTAKAGSGPIGVSLDTIAQSIPEPVPARQPTGPTSLGTFQAADSSVTISGILEPATVQPGQTARLVLSAQTAPNWHVYAYADRDDGEGSHETLIAFDRAWGLSLARPTTDAPIVTDSSVLNFPTMYFHPGQVTWTIDVTVPKSAELGEYPINGVVAYQACEYNAENFGSCEMPKAARFIATLNVGGPVNAASTPLHFTPAIYADAADIARAWSDSLTGLPPSPRPTATNSAEVPGIGSADLYDLSLVQVQEQSGSLWSHVLFAFLGGLILNLMPCVLPVIGLKVMSFVEQAGKSRAHAFYLNAWYSAGIIAVFLLLAVLATSLNLTWGGQFGSTAFNVTLAAVVFAMALSLLGVWEVPIPGFFGSGKIQDAAAQEGPAGAFLKGAVTTVLATPCTAPFMASAVAWAVSQNATTTYIVFAALGLGMASPYLLVGVFPELLRFLPKPGRWMETFKQVTGFILLATVVFILTFLDPAAVVPTALLLVGVGATCWLVARTPLTAELRDKLQTWAMSAAVLLLFAVASFGWLYPEVMYPRYGGLQARMAEGWDPFSLAQLQKTAVREGRTVIVDFSADWCVNCIFLEKTQLHTKQVDKAIADANAVKLYADFSDYPEEIADTIKALKSNGVPVIAIFSGDKPYEPIVLRDGYSAARVAAELSKTRPGQSTAARQVDPAAEITAATR